MTGSSFCSSFAKSINPLFFSPRIEVASKRSLPWSFTTKSSRACGPAPGTAARSFCESFRIKNRASPMLWDAQAGAPDQSQNSGAPPMGAPIILIFTAGAADLASFEGRNRTLGSASEMSFSIRIFISGKSMGSNFRAIISGTHGKSAVRVASPSRMTRVN